LFDFWYLREFSNPPKSAANSSGISMVLVGTVANQTYGGCVDMVVAAANTTATNSAVHVGNSICEIQMEGAKPRETLSIEAPLVD
jgi:hypothetical protein